MNVQLLPAQINEVERVSQFVRLYYEEDQLDYNPKVQSAISQLLEHPDWGGYWKILADQEWIGLIGFTYAFDSEVGGRLGIVTDFYIEPASRGQGIGSKALQLLLEQARSMALNQVGLVVLRHNTRVRRLYEAAGFSTEPDRDWYWLGLN